MAACFSLDEYDRDVIKKHERTRKDKEDDRTRHMVELRAQTGPVFLAYRPTRGSTSSRGACGRADEPLVDFTALDGVRHAIWRVDAALMRGVRRGVRRPSTRSTSPTGIIARRAPRARAMPSAIQTRRDFFLAVAFPSDQLRILPYNRVVRDLNGMTPEHFLGEVARTFAMTSGPATPAEKGEVSMYVAGTWYTVDLESAGVPGASVIDSARRQRAAGAAAEADPRHSGCAHRQADRLRRRREGHTELEQLVDSGRMAVAFSMYPVSVVELMDVSDAGEIMPPKSTWFEPKLRDGLLIHEI